jgi:hypothetical protein
MARNAVKIKSGLIGFMRRTVSKFVDADKKPASWVLL